MRTIISIAALLSTLATVEAQGFSVAQYGPTCGPIATGAVTPQSNHWRFEFTVSNAEPRVDVINILGVSRQNTPINFGFACFLLTDIAFSQIHKTDETGAYTWSHAVPYGPGGFSGEAYVQFAEITFDQSNMLLVRTSNGLHMTPD